MVEVFFYRTELSRFYTAKNFAYNERELVGEKND